MVANLETMSALTKYCLALYSSLHLVDGPLLQLSPRQNAGIERPVLPWGVKCQRENNSAAVRTVMAAINWCQLWLEHH
jgi:hypothetical protein